MSLLLVVFEFLPEYLVLMRLVVNFSVSQWGFLELPIYLHILFSKDFLGG
jgi:hypothetical protein